MLVAFLLVVISSQLLPIFALALLGTATGVLAGLSRESAIGAVVPAVLSLVGGLSIYLLGLKKGDSKLVNGAVVALSISLILGTFWGAMMRSFAERDHANWQVDMERSKILWKTQQERENVSLARRKLEALDEDALNTFRRKLGLPPLPPLPASAAKAEPVDGDSEAATSKKK